MSQRLINLNHDLKRLRDEGFDIEVKSSHLMVKGVPYVNSLKEITYGTLVSTLALNGDLTLVPDTHVAYLIGDYPCHIDGTPMEKIRNNSARMVLAKGVEVDHSFSAKPPPPDRYNNYYEKIKTYVDILSGPAINLSPKVTAKSFNVSISDNESPFNYADTASSRAQIGGISQKLEVENVAIVGLGGTGSYVLDLVAKTPVREIHVFDGDLFLQHNAFRSPGAPTIEELKQKASKVAYFQSIYSKMHRGIKAHEVYVDAANIETFKEFKFVFLCLDSGPAKKLIVEKLIQYEIPFIDVGIGVSEVEGALNGTVRVTTITPESKKLGINANRISYGENATNEYTNNIQIADLNALNATLAVIKWKKLRGFYLDLEKEHSASYMINGNALLNEDTHEN